MQILIKPEVLQVRIDEVTEEEEELEGDALLQVLIQMGEVEDLSPGSEVANNLLILSLLDPSDIFALILE